MKYKVGDKVRIKSLDWYNANKDDFGRIRAGATFILEMAQYCNKEALVVEISGRGSYYLNIDCGYFDWADNFFDENCKDMETKKIVLPEGWEIDKVEGNEIILKESKKELPKTWEECMRIFEREARNDERYDGLMEVLFHKEGSNDAGENRSWKYFLPVNIKVFESFIRLLACREVYRDGWVPNWNNEAEKHVICFQCGNIDKARNRYCSSILSFQSEEVRSQFLENFRDLIEEAKELI